MEVEQLFICHNGSEEKRVPTATLTFQRSFMHWWTSLVKEKQIMRDPSIKYWNELRSALRRRHIPPYYERELMDVFQRLQQRNQSVEEYKQQMELLMLRAGIREEKRTTIARFQSGLNIDIRDKVELFPYRDLNELVQLCIRVENLIKDRKKSTSYPNNDYKKEGSSSQSNIERSQEKNKKKEKENPRDKSSIESRTSSIKCFKCLRRGYIASQCPTKKTMILKDDNIYISDSTTSSSSSSEEDIQDSSEEVSPCDEDLLVAQRLLANQIQEQDKFHTRCKILKNSCSLIMDSGSCNNFCSTRLVEKLHLTLIAHPKSYKLQWLNEDGSIEVKDQVNISLTTGKYKYEDQLKMTKKREKKKTQVLEKSKEDSISSKNLMIKESHFSIKNDCKRTFILHKDFSSSSTTAIDLELKIQNLNIFESKGSQVLSLVKKKWT
uniref:Retrotransposon gag domain-containing protein n=1 Tax=Cajanus cajan TaxID=3821 RepID=A0A151RL66_CAJCA|nr:hypothetical protein KK1_035283 [Cajanus cajan]